MSILYLDEKKVIFVNKKVINKARCNGLGERKESFHVFTNAINSIKYYNNKKYRKNYTTK